MNKTEAISYIRLPEAEANKYKELFSQANRQPHEKNRLSQETEADLYQSDRKTYIALYIAQTKSAHRMIRSLLKAPRSTFCGPVTTSQKSKGHSPTNSPTIRERFINTPEIGEFKAQSKVLYAHTINSKDTSLSLAFVYPHGSQPNSSNDDKLELIIDTRLDELTFDKLYNISDDQLAKVSVKRGIVANVCHHAGLAITPVTFEPVALR